VVARRQQSQRQVVVDAVALSDLAQLADRHSQGVVDIDAVSSHSRLIAVAAQASQLSEDGGAEDGSRRKMLLAGWKDGGWV